MTLLKQATKSGHISLHTHPLAAAGVVVVNEGAGLLGPPSELHDHTVKHTVKQREGEGENFAPKSAIRKYPSRLNALSRALPHTQCKSNSAAESMACQARQICRRTNGARLGRAEQGKPELRLFLHTQGLYKPTTKTGMQQESAPCREPCRCRP
jgi:hypothetical protein